MGKPKPLASVSRAITLIEYLAKQSSQGTSLGVLASDLGINKATAYNTLATLREHDWVEQDQHTGYYRLGNGIAPIAQYRTATSHIVDKLRPALAHIGQRFNELVHLGRLVNTDIIYLDKVEPDRSVRVISAVGKRTPAISTALGRALIGTFENREELIDWYMSATQVEARTAADKEKLHTAVVANFANLDERGWTEEFEENEPGIACVAVPLISESTENLAISVSAPAERMTTAYRAEIAAGIRAELAELPSDLPLCLRPITE